MPRFARAALLFATTARLAARAGARRRRHVDLRRLPRRQDARRLWLGARPGVARQGARRRGAADRRLLGQLRLGRGPDPDQPPLRRAVPRRTFDRRATTSSRPASPPHPRARRRCAPASRPRSSPRSADVTPRGEGRDRQRRPARPRSRRAPPPSRGSKRPAAPTPPRPAARSSALYGGGQYKLYTYRKYSRRPHRLGARGPGRAIRRRSRQFQFPALLDGCQLPARL